MLTCLLKNIFAFLKMPRQPFNLKKKATSDKNNIKISNLIIFFKKENKLVKLIFFPFFFGRTWRTQNIHVTSSASSSSSILQNYKFKRAILVGKRGGPLRSCLHRGSWARLDLLLLHCVVPWTRPNWVASKPSINTRTNHSSSSSRYRCRRGS